MDLSQYHPSENFVKLFGELPTRTLPGENFWDMRARRVSYLQHIMDWDPVSILDSGIFESHTSFFEAFGLTPYYFTSEKRNGIFLSFKEVPGMDIWESWDANHTQGIYVVQAQAKLISNSIKPSLLYPHPGLKDMYEQKFGE